MKPRKQKVIVAAVFAVIGSCFGWPLGYWLASQILT
jgi:uncharacterized membrane protein